MIQRRIAHLLERHHVPASEGSYDYSLDLMGKLLGHAGLTLNESTGQVFHWNPTDVILMERLAAYQPHLVIIWEQHGHISKAFAGGQKRNVDDWAGYVWKATGVMSGVKVIMTYAPARLTKEYGLTGIVKFHLAKAAREVLVDELVVPQRFIRVLSPENGFDVNHVLAHFRTMQASKKLLAHDIEGGAGMGPACYGFAASKDCAVVVPIYTVDGESVWSEADEILITEAVQALLEDEEVPKVIQNFSFEAFVEAWTVGIVIKGLKDDTMLKHWELYAELEKSLEFQASIYTNQPHWKLEHRLVEGRYKPFRNGKPVTSEEWYVYNGTDCCVTYEVNEVMEAKLLPGQRQHYEFNMQLLAPLAYMSLRGMRFDEAMAKERLKAVEEEIYELQDQINREAAAGRPALQKFYSALGAKCSIQGQGISSSDGAMDQGEGQRQSGGVGRPDLQQFYEGLRLLEESASPGMVQDDSKRTSSQPSGQHHKEDVSKLVPLLTSAFCQAVRRERVKEEQTEWQPMQVNTKGRWVKHGKRLKSLEEFENLTNDPLWLGQEAPEPEDWPKQWLKPITRLKEVSRPVEVKTFEDMLHWCKDSCKDNCKRAIKILQLAAGDGSNASAARGELSTLLGIHCNINSTGRDKDSKGEDGKLVKGDERDANWFLYEHCKAPHQYKREKGKATNKLTSSNDAVLLAYIATEDPRLKLFMTWRSKDTERETLRKGPDIDGRMRCSYTLPGTKTGRLSCSESVTGSGYNLQTTTEGLRDLILADEGCEFGQFDLRGADGYTIAAQCIQHGDDTMMKDLLAGIKPVNIIVLLYTEGVHINQLSREELLAAQKRVNKESWQYIATKPIFYGYTYLMGAKKMSEGIAEDSYKETGMATVVSPARCTEIMRMIDLRYPGIRRMQEAEGRKMMKDGVLHSTVGWARRFFGRKSHKAKVGNVWHESPDRTTHGDWLATLPQFNTTYATKRGLLALWTDPDNRREDGSLVVEPLHTVHDSLNVQWRVEDREFAARKVLPIYFNNPFNVAGQTLNIPASGTYGPNWKDQHQNL